MLRPLPYPDGRRSCACRLRRRNGHLQTESSAGIFGIFRERARSFSGIARISRTKESRSPKADSAEQVVGAILTPACSACSECGRRSVACAEEDGGDDPSVPVTISYDVWQGRFGGDSSIVGKHIELESSGSG
jgi:hypothetical protein